MNDKPTTCLSDKKRPLLKIILFLAIIAAGAFLVCWTAIRSDHEMRTSLLQQTRMVAQTVSVEHIRALTGTAADLRNPHYRRLKEQLSIIRSATPHCRYIYLLGRNSDGRVFFFMDSEPADSKDCSPPGQIYSESSECQQSVFTTQPEAVEGPSSDRWGTWVSGLLQIKDPQMAAHGLATTDDARAMVRRAVDFYRKNGRQRLLNELKNPRGEFRKGELYAFAYDKDMTMLAHPVKPELIGKNLLNKKDWSGGKYFRREIQSIAISKGSGWVDYEYESPINMHLDQKTTFVEGVDDMIICAGAYKGTGKTLAVLGMDVDANSWRWTVARSTLPAVLLTLSLVIILFTGSSLLSRRSLSTDEPRRWMRHIESGLVIAVGLALTLFAVWMVYADELSKRSENFDDIARDKTRQIADTLSGLGNTELEGLAEFYQSSDNVTPADFRQYTAYLTKNSAVKAWEWVPAVPATDKSEFEIKARASGATGFQIWQRDEQGNRKSVSGRNVYYPVLLVAPVHGNERAKGFDLGSESVRRAAIEEASHTRLTTSTDTINLVQETGHQKGMLIFRPVFDTLNRKHLRGFALAVLQMQNLMSGYADNVLLTELSLLHKDAKPEHLASSWGAGSPPAFGLLSTRQVCAFGKVFSITAYAGSEFKRSQRLWAIWLTALTGMLITAALAFVISVVSRKHDELERIVAKRTYELQESEQSYRNQFAKNSAMMLLIDPKDGSIIDANAAAVNFYGYPIDRLLKLHMTEINILPASETQKAMASVKPEHGERFEFQHRLADNSVRHVHVFASLIEFGGRHVLHSIIGDITERRKAEAALQRSESLQRLLIDNIDAGIAIIDVETHTIELVNQACLDLFGGAEEDLIGRVCHCLLCPADKGKCPVTDGGQEIENSDRILVRADGTHIPVLKSVRRVWIEGKEKTLETFVDITERKLAEDSLRESEANFRTFFESINDIILVGTPEGKITYANDATVRKLGYSTEELCSMHVLDVHPADKRQEAERIFGAMFRGEQDYCPLPLATKGGMLIPVETRVWFGKWNGVDCIFGISKDLSAEQEAQQRFERLFRNNPTLMALSNLPDRRFIDVNDAFLNMLGYSRDEIIGKTSRELGLFVKSEQQSSLADKLAADSSIAGVELEVICKDGTIRQGLFSGEVISSQGRQHFLSVMIDITDRKQKEEELRKAKAELDLVNSQLEKALLDSKQYALSLEIANSEIIESAAELTHQATHDSLTDLPNRHYYEEHLKKLTEGVRNQKLRSLAVLFIDLDNFKMVNDTMGHKAGDALLVEAATRLSSCLRDGDTLARLGGDEFAVLLKDIKTADDAALVAQRMLEQVSTPFEIDGSMLVVGASIGISLCPDNATNSVELLKSADTAMYRAKELGRNNFQFFSEELSQKNQARSEMERDLRLAIERDEIKVYYQPIVDVKTMRIAGAEALLRWDHPEKGMISPGLFIPVAEQTGLIVQMGQHVLHSACKQCKIWRDLGYTDFEMSVNVSPIQLSDIGFVSEVDAALTEACLPASNLKLEVTETSLAKNENDELDVLGILRSYGVSISLDDFGVGFSSLSRLSKLPVSHVKIDGCFIRNCDNNKGDRAMTESIIVMAHNLGMRVTAEWVEDRAQMSTIKALDCDYAQGYLISPALSPEAFERFIQRWLSGERDVDAA